MHEVAVIGGWGRGSDLGPALLATSRAANFRVALLGRDRDALDATAGEGVLALAGDLTDGDFVTAAVARIERELGAVTVYIHNAASLVRGPFLEQRPADFEAAWRAGFLSAVTCSQALLPSMLARGRGNLIFTGATASKRGSAGFAPFAAAKFALRGLAQSLAREFGPRGIHVAHVLVDGLINGRRARETFAADPERCIDSLALAKTYLMLIQQDPSCWVHELDVRPSGEVFS